MTLPEVDGHKYVVVAIDYFSKWSEARSLKDKTAVSVARFIYDDIICRHGCPKIQISDQGREFINSLNDELSRLTGTQLRVTSAYHPQANGLVERQNRTIKNCLLKVLQNNVEKWPYILQGVLFAHRTAQHFSTGYSPFKILYQREAILPVDVDDEDSSMDFEPILDRTDEKEEIEDPLKDLNVFNEDAFQKTLNQMMKIRDVIQNHAKKNIEEAQKRQRYSYAKRHKTSKDYIFKKYDKVLVRNLIRDDRKGGWRNMPWVGPYIIETINSGNTCTLKSGDRILKKKQNLSNLKIFKEKSDIEKNLEEFMGDVQKNTYEKLKVEESTANGELSEDDNVFIRDVNLKDDRIFNPISKSWQKIKCKQFNLKLKDCLNFKGTKNILGEPTSTIPIRGDGNCLYRTIAYWMSGDEENHLTIRSSISKVIIRARILITFLHFF